MGGQFLKSIGHTWGKYCGESVGRVEELWAVLHGGPQSEIPLAGLHCLRGEDDTLHFGRVTHGIGRLKVCEGAEQPGSKSSDDGISYFTAGAGALSVRG